MTALYGWAGKILFIDLETQKTRTEPTADYKSFIGGRGINQRLLFNLVEPNVDPLDPENPLILGAGVMVGTPVPTAARLSVEHKNVMTGGLGSGNLGGFFAAEMKFAGFDHIVIQGRAQKPTYLFIKDDRVFFRSAREIWGQDTWQTDITLKRMENETSLSTLAIGPAGENMVRFACIIGDQGRASGYGGSGAVMGGKNLKAIAIKGTRRTLALAKAGAFKVRLEKFMKEVFNKANAVNAHQKGGTLGAYLLSGKERPHGVRNLMEDFLSNEDLRGISREEFDAFLIKRRGCSNCPVQCGGHFQVKGVDCEGIQANSLRAFGTNLAVNKAQDVLFSHALANLYGLDVDQTSAVVAWGMDCFEKGIIDTKDTGGVNLRFGDGKSAAKLIRMVAFREGLGDLLAEGVERAAIKLGRGSEKLTAVVKGNSVVESGMRTHRAWTLGVITSTKGTGHLRGSPGLEFQSLTPEESRTLFGLEDVSDPTSYENKGAFVVWQEQYKGVVDMMGICALMTMWMDKTLFLPEEIAGLFNDITGLSYSADDLLEVGEKVHNLERVFNLMHTGFDRNDDMPPRKFVDIPVNKGAFKGQSIDIKKWNQMLDEYYELHGWDQATGRPTRERLKELNLSFALEKLAENGIKI